MKKFKKITLREGKINILNIFNYVYICFNFDIKNAYQKKMMIKVNQFHSTFHFV